VRPGAVRQRWGMEDSPSPTAADSLRPSLTVSGRPAGNPAERFRKLELERPLLMPRAFLSHSTDDQAYVHEVAQRLGRHRTHIDIDSFRAGEDFRDAIRRTLDDSDVFILFVSPRSLASSWVKFELDEAEIRKVRGTLRRAVAIFIEGPVNPSAIPQWLARVRAVHHTTPGQSARAIESLILGSAPDAQRPFLGRNDDLQRGIRKLASGNPPPRLLLVSGLEGIGRRSYLSRLVGDALRLDLGPIVSLSTTGTLEDLYLESHLSSTMLTRAEAEREIATFRALSIKDQSREVASQLVFLAEQGTVPCIVDNGAMLDSAGKYLPEYADLLTHFVSTDDVYLALVHVRVPDYGGLPVRVHVFDRRLRPLAPPDAQALVARLLRDANVPAEPDQTARLAEVTGGYPPAAYFLVARGFSVFSVRDPFAVGRHSGCGRTYG
jgi:hypothetical protein